MQEHGGNLTAGIALLPGKPQAVAVCRPAQGETPAEACYQAFLLPEVPAVDAESSILIPHGWFRSGQALEVYSDTLQHIGLKRLIHEGPTSTASVLSFGRCEFCEKGY